MKNANLVLFMVAVFACSIPASFAADSPPAKNPPAEPVQHAYLGVVVAPAHPALAANLGGLLNPEQGLTVEDIADKSAAMKAGIKIHDILTAYDDQKLFSSEQLVKLVRYDQPGRELNLEYLREGKLQKVKVVLGKLDTTDFRAWSPSPRAQPFRFGRPDRVPRRLQATPTPAFEWDNFQSLTLKKRGDDQFRIEMQALDKDGKPRTLAFEGTREEIHAAIDADKSLKPVERAHFFRTLNLRDSDDDSPFPHLWFEPGSGWFFEQPGGPFH